MAYHFHRCPLLVAVSTFPPYIWYPPPVHDKCIGAYYLSGQKRLIFLVCHLSRVQEVDPFQGVRFLAVYLLESLRLLGGARLLLKSTYTIQPSIASGLPLCIIVVTRHGATNRFNISKNWYQRGLPFYCCGASFSLCWRCKYSHETGKKRNSCVNFMTNFVSNWISILKLYLYIQLLLVSLWALGIVG